MPAAASKEVAVRMSLGLRRNPLTQKLEAHMQLQQFVGEGTTTVQEGTFAIGEDQLYSRLQEHLNNYLRQLTNNFDKLERIYTR